LATFDFRVMGDVDGDGAFTSADLLSVFQQGQFEDDLPQNSDYSSGDWNGDREFDSSDLVRVFTGGQMDNQSYPRLFFEKHDIPHLREKLTTRTEQYEREIQLATSAANTDFSDPSLFENDKAHAGQRFAFLALIMDQSDPRRVLFAQKAREVLANANEGSWSAFGRFPERRATFDLSAPLHPWTTGDTLMNLSLTYDWLVGAGELKGIARQDARFRILRLMQMEHHQQKIPYDDFPHSDYPIRLANYMLRSVSGVGFASVAFPDQIGTINDPYERLLPEHIEAFSTQGARDWVLGELFTEITTSSASDPAEGESLVEHYISPDGFVREGTTYQIDSYGVLIPFLSTLYRHTGLDYFTSDGLTDGRILESFITNAKIMLPNGYRPLIGDAFLGRHYIWPELLTEFVDDATAGSFIEQGRSATTNFGVSLPFYNDAIPHELTQYRTEFLPDSGLAVLRDEWGPYGTHMLVTAQDFTLKGHIQADQASITLFANTTPLIIENGYGNAYRLEEKARAGGSAHWIQSSLGHNTMTIDSLYRPEDTPEVDIRYAEVTPRVRPGYSGGVDPATIENTMATDQIDYVEAHVDYTTREADLVRAIAFPRHRYFVLEDTMTSDETHEYGWQLHLGRTETGTLEGGDGNYVWTTPNTFDSSKTSSLGIYMLDDENRNVNVYGDGPTNRSGYGYPSQVFEHTYVLADKTTEDLRYVTILDPFVKESEQLQVETIVAGKVWKVVHSDSSYDLIVSQDVSEQIEFDEVTTDAQFAVISIDVAGGRETVVSALARGGTTLKIGYDQSVLLSTAGEPLFHYMPGE
ncbi:MAG: heparinase II/III family protein, partial [Planctomycetales bacterium]|nr:heparinase II/III family protein [Planctomycetales bacterium]